jgi:uncharacterized GH25 family protein
VNSRTTSALIGLLSVTGAPSGQAHDFWLQPREYWVAPRELDWMTLQVGHGPFRQRSPIPLRRIIRYEDITPGGAAIDLRYLLRLGQSDRDGDFRLEQPGTHVLVLQTDDQAQVRLPALRFNDYLRAEGLTPALEQRERMQRMGEDAAERYSRCSKAIVQVGTGDASPSIAQEPAGLPLEIVPESNPYATPRSTTLPVRVIYAGRPLAGALVKLTNLQQDDAPFEVRLTDQAGRARFGMPSSGAWLVNVIWTRPLPPTEEVDFETIFSSLSFAIPPDGR